MGVVSQETYLLHTTVRENLRYARPGATDAEIEDAARAAQIHDLIAGLPDGYDTMVGSRGHRFSGGEKQRLAIARTLLRDPRVLVLDEATSALDTETERAVQKAFDALARGRTTITIAHRLSTVRNADQIVVLDHGRRSSKRAPTPASSPATAATPSSPPRPGPPRAVAALRSGNVARAPSAGRLARRAGPRWPGRSACSREHHHVDRPPTVPCAIGAPSRGQVPPGRRAAIDVAGMRAAVGDG